MSFDTIRDDTTCSANYTDPWQDHSSVRQKQGIESVVGTGVTNTTIIKFAAKVVVLGSLKLP